MALLYSMRFKRWMAGRPGLGFVEAARSRAASSDSVNALAAEGSGRGSPRGGISPVLTLRRTFSKSLAFSPGLARFTFSRTMPAVFACSLWQLTQYRASSVFSGAAGCCPSARETQVIWMSPATEIRRRPKQETPHLARIVSWDLVMFTGLKTFLVTAGSGPQ